MLKAAPTPQYEMTYALVCSFQHYKIEYDKRTWCPSMGKLVKSIVLYPHNEYYETGKKKKKE